METLQALLLTWRTEGALDVTLKVGLISGMGNSGNLQPSLGNGSLLVMRCR